MLQGLTIHWYGYAATAHGGPYLATLVRDARQLLTELET
jgi:hypothetical protein